MINFEQIKFEAFKDELQKIAFVAPPQAPATTHKGWGEQASTVAKHPFGFAKSVLGGEAAGLAGGAVGGALVAAPLAMYLARKPGAGNFGHHLVELAKGETIGGGVIGMGLGANKFFNKYKNERQNA